MLACGEPQPDKRPGSALFAARGRLHQEAANRAQLAGRDTLGTLTPSVIEIIALFLLAVPRVMGRKAPR
jgi:hypothetical protein